MINQIDISKQITKALPPSDLLIIIPPFATTRTPILGPLILNKIADALGFKTSVLHLNLLLASIISIDTYERICYNQPFRMLFLFVFPPKAHQDLCKFYHHHNPSI